MADPIGVALFEDHPVVIEGVRSWIIQDTAQRLQLVYSAATLDGIDNMPAGSVDVLVIDLQLADGLAIDRVEDLAAAGWRIVVFSGSARTDLIRRVTIAGVGAYIAKDQHEVQSHLIEAIVTVAHGEYYTPPSQASVILADTRPRFSAQELRAMHLWLQGFTMGQVGRRMGISEHTVKGYLERARKKYKDVNREAPTKDALLRNAIQDGIVEA